MNLRLFPLFAAVSSVAFAQPRPLEGNPGNVFVVGQEVVVKAGEGKWICVDYDGKPIAEGTGEAKLGKVGVGYYEIWQLGDDGSRKTRTTFAVLAPLKVPVPENTPIALDTAAAWFYKDGKEAKGFGLREAANLSALAGVGWVRDRLSWKATEPEKGKFAENTIYDRSADAFASQGLRVLQVFHDTPPWAGKDPKHFPDDLRDGYHYLKAMSARWKVQVLAWEPWNEGDTTNFGGHTGAEMMAYQRAAYHGIRAGNPDAIVGQNVFAEPHRTGVLENFIENRDPPIDGSASFPFDTFNFHHYVQPGSISGAYEAMRPAAWSLPVWVTESYFHFRQGVKTSDLDLTEEQRKLRARFVTTNLVTALNEDPAQFFTFVLPHYVESGVLFGLLNADGTPRADYLALAAAGRLLAGARTTGIIHEEFPVYTFSSMPDGEWKTVVVIWSENERPLPEKLRGYEKAYDFIGREVKPEVVGEEPLYLVFEKSAFAMGAQPPAILRPPDSIPASPLVVQAVFPRDRLRLASSSWRMNRGETWSVPLRLYHFGKGAAKVTVTVEAEPALKASVKESSFTIDPEGRVDGLLDLAWSQEKMPARPVRVKVTAKTDGMPPCVAVFRISTEMGDVPAVAVKPVAAAKLESQWAPSSSPGKVGFLVGNGKLIISAELESGDRWVYPWLNVGPKDRPDASYDGIRFTITPQEGTAFHHVMLREPGGATYVASLGQVAGDGKERKVVVLFDEFHWAGYTPEDKNRKLDIESIEGLAIGGNPKEDAKFRYTVKDVEWVKFAD